MTSRCMIQLLLGIPVISFTIRNSVGLVAEAVFVFLIFQTRRNVWILHNPLI